jgi:FlaA1/EpsC-like NDP-sugar epimerase
MSNKSLADRHYKWRRVLSRLLVYAMDLIAFAISAVFAFELRFDGVLPARFIHPMEVALGVWAITKSAVFIACMVNRYWRHTSAYDAVRIVCANAVGSLLGAPILLFLLGLRGIPRSVYVLDWLVCCMLTLGGRLIVYLAFTARRPRRNEGARTRTLIYGAGSAGLALAWELRQNQSLKCDVVGFLDDDPSKAGLSLQGKRVLGTGDALGTLARKHAIKSVLIAIPSATPQQMVHILKLALDAGVEYKMVPSLGELIQGRELDQQIRNVAVEDLLGRKPAKLDQHRIRERIEGKVVMVTGAAGSIGSEICRQISRFQPLALVGFDEAETPLFHLERELAKDFPDVAFYPEIGSISRSDILQKVMQRYQPSILYHAAAYKHVPLMERNMFAAVENNIFGTWQVARAAIRYGIDDFVMISTDKAVRPTSMMGATKRVAEVVIRALQRDTGTKFVAVRFGNVLGSNGSVVPIFKEQIAAGGPVTVTHPDMQRYFMTIPEAAQLVLQAFTMGQGGEIFVLDMGEPVRIVDLARNLILLSGLQPERDIRIEFTGLRPGEKLFEELNLQDEHLALTSHPQIRSYVSTFDIDTAEINEYLHDLQRVVEAQDVARLVLLLKELIPDYNPGTRLLKIAMSMESNHVGSLATQRSARQGNGSAATKLTPISRIN